MTEFPVPPTGLLAALRALREVYLEGNADTAVEDFSGTWVLLFSHLDRMMTDGEPLPEQWSR